MVRQNALQLGSQCCVSLNYKHFGGEYRRDANLQNSKLLELK